MSPNLAGSYTRHSVEKDIEEFDGWEALLSTYEQIKRKEDFEVAQVYEATFLTGGRIGESDSLRPDMFQFKTEVITLADGRQLARDVFEVTKMPLEKRYKKLSNYLERRTQDELPGSAVRRLFPSEPNAQGIYERKRFKTEKQAAVRKPFDIPFDEVPKEMRIMHEDLKWYLSTMKGQPWLFPSRTKSTRHMSRSFVWGIFKNYTIKGHYLYPHYLRGQRASCLITWNGLSMEQMMEWMTWEELRTAMHYAKMGKSKLLGVFRRFE